MSNNIFNASEFCHRYFNMPIGKFVERFNNISDLEFDQSIHRAQLKALGERDIEFIDGSIELLNELSVILNQDRLETTYYSIKEIKSYLPKNELANFVNASKVQPK